MTTIVVSPFQVVLSMSFILLGAAGCSDADNDSSGSTASAGGSGEAGGGSTSSSSASVTGGDGGGGGSTPESVVGTVHDGECETAQAFADACDAEGGLLGDNCQEAFCGGSGYRATCYEPPPAPSAEEFSCDGLFNCAVGEICSIFDPRTDGCFDHACATLPSACTDDPSCECLLAASELEDEECEEDVDGNVTFRSGPV